MFEIPQYVSKYPVVLRGKRYRLCECTCEPKEKGRYAVPAIAEESKIIGDRYYPVTMILFEPGIRGSMQPKCVSEPPIVKGKEKDLIAVYNIYTCEITCMKRPKGC